MSNYLSPKWLKRLLEAGFPPADLPTGDAEEILRRLPYVEIYKHDVNYRILKRGTQEEPLAIQHIDDTLANAAAAMYCDLAANKLLP